LRVLIRETRVAARREEEKDKIERKKKKENKVLKLRKLVVA
jgi:hypothetical protein